MLQLKKMFVCLDIRHSSARRIMSGVMRFISTHSGWEVNLVQEHPASTSFPPTNPPSQKIDALIIGSNYLNISKAVYSALNPSAIVYINSVPQRDKAKHIAVLRSDERALALAAAELFLRKHIPNVAFIGAPTPIWWSKARALLFKAALANKHLQVHIFTASTPNRQHKFREELTKWIKKLPRPCGVWAAYDELAKQILDICHAEQLAVPEDIQVLGVDNESYICEYTSPSLSSIEPDFEAGGYRAAEYLDSVVGKKHSPTTRVTHLSFGVKGVIERLSTADIHGALRYVALAREFIRLNATSGIDITAVVTAAKTSRRLLERSFRQTTGRSILDFIQDERFNKLREMLKKTTTPVEVCCTICGFKSPTHAMTLFKKRYGKTMTQYRQDL